MHYLKVSILLLTLILLSMSCFHEPTDSNVLPARKNLRVYQAGDYIEYKVTGVVSYPELDGSNQPVVSLGNNCSGAQLVGFGDPCMFAETLETRDAFYEVLDYALLRVDWSTPVSAVDSTVTGSPKPADVLQETWTLTPANSNLSPVQTSRFVTQVNIGDISGQTILHAYSAPSDVNTPVYYINQAGDNLTTVNQQLIDDSPMVTGIDDTFRFNILANCSATGCEAFANSIVTTLVESLSQEVIPNFRAAPVQVFHYNKTYDNLLTGVTYVPGSSEIDQLPANTGRNLGVNLFTQCDGLRIATGTNPLPQIEVFNNGFMQYFPELGALTINNNCQYVQAVDYVTGFLKQLSAAGSFDPQGKPLSYSWSVTPLAGADLSNGAPTVLSANSIIAGFYAFGAGDYRADVSVSNGTQTANDSLYFKVFDFTYTGVDWPVALASTNRYTTPNTAITLDGGASSGVGLSYAWTLMMAPPGAIVNIANDTAVSTDFSADLTGEYQVDLTVTDSNNNSSTDSVFIYVENNANYPQINVTTLTHTPFINLPTSKRPLASSMSMNAEFFTTNIAIEGR